MKFTIVFVIALSITTAWAIKTKIEEPKGKRETLGGYPSTGHSSQSYQAPSLGHEGASAISVGAGYSIGGAKPSFTYGEPINQHESGATYQLSSEGVPSSGHSLQLAPITLQGGHGLISNDLSQLMSQLSHGLNTGAISIPGAQDAIYQFGGQSAHGQGGQGGQDAIYQFGGQSAHGQGGQELSFPQFSYGAPKYQQYSLGEQNHGSAVPSYAAGTKGLGSFGSTGPVLFSPSEAQGAALAYSAPNAGHSYAQASLPLGDSGHSLSGLSLGSGHSFGGSLKQIGGSYLPPSKTSFKPSAYLGSSVQSEGHGLSALSGSYGGPSFGSYQSSSGGHGLSLGSGQGHSGSFGGSLAGFGGGSSKFIAPSYLPPKSEGSFGSLESIAAFSSGGHLASPPGTTYGIPTGSYSAGNAHTASSSPQYYVTKQSSSPSSFGHGSSSFRGPASSHSSLSSFSGPKYSFGGHSSSRYGPPKDVQGAYSETSYNTIKYSEELKPRNH